MNKAEFIDAVASKSELTKQDAKKKRLMDYSKSLLRRLHKKKKFKSLDLVHLKYVNVPNVQAVTPKQVNKS